MPIVTIILTLLAILAVLTLGFIIVDFLKHKDNLEECNVITVTLVGFIMSLFDVLGIGNFATITVSLKLLKQCKDKLIPGTLNVGLALPVMLEAFIFIKDVKVETLTLVTMIVVATLGSWVGAGIVSKLPERKIQVGMGICLLVTAVLMLLGKFDLMPSGGNAVGLSGIKLIVACIINFILGGLMTLGIGLYAPCMALVYALGMSPLVAFPIMFGSCAFLMPVAAIRFVKLGTYNRKVSLILMVSGILAVLIATRFVIKLPIETLLWIVIFVVIYTAITMLKSSKEEKVQES